jgi:hypothetical protein
MRGCYSRPVMFCNPLFLPLLDCLPAIHLVLTQFYFWWELLYHGMDAKPQLYFVPCVYCIVHVHVLVPCLDPACQCFKATRPGLLHAHSSKHVVHTYIHTCPLSTGRQFNHMRCSHVGWSDMQCRGTTKAWARVYLTRQPGQSDRNLRVGFELIGLCWRRQGVSTSCCEPHAEHNIQRSLTLMHATDGMGLGDEERTRIYYLLGLLSFFFVLVFSLLHVVDRDQQRVSRSPCRPCCAL